MDCLPGLPVGGSQAWFPLSAMTAAALVGALAEDGARRIDALVAALWEDASLAIWADLAARGAPGLGEPGDPRWLAGWLAVQLPQRWPESADGAEWDNRRSEWWADLAAADWALAGCVRELAAPGGAETATRLSWQALLSRRGRWLNLAADHDSSATETADSDAGDRDRPPPALEMRARDVLAAGLPKLEPGPAELAACAERWRERAAEYRRRWLAVDPRWSALLPGMCRLVRRAEAHDERFAERLREAKLSALKEFAYGAGHEINNPLANIASRAQSLLADETHPERRRKLAAINAQAFRAHEMLADLMLFARPPALRCQAVELPELVSEVLEQLRPAAETQGTRLEVARPGPAIQAWGDPLQLRVALVALVQNALEALGGGGQVTLELAESEAGPLDGAPRKRAVCVAVCDNGPGIAPDDLDRIFDPFYCGREAGRGLGFGLPKCWRIAAEHGGRLEVHSELGRGATFRLWLPVRAAENLPSTDGAQP